MRKTLLASTMLAALPIAAHAQTIQSGTIGGMPYQVLMPSTPCIDRQSVRYSNLPGIPRCVVSGCHNSADELLRGRYLAARHRHRADDHGAAGLDHGLGRLRQDRYGTARPDGCGCPRRRSPDGQCRKPGCERRHWRQPGRQWHASVVDRLRSQGCRAAWRVFRWRLLRRRDLFRRWQRAGRCCALRCAVDGSARNGRHEPVGHL